MGWFGNIKTIKRHTHTALFPQNQKQKNKKNQTRKKGIGTINKGKQQAVFRKVHCGIKETYHVYQQAP